MKKGKQKRLLVNMMLAIIIIGLYFALISPYSVPVMANTKLPIYKGSAKTCVALQCTVDWDAAAIPQILDTLKSNDTRITFMVSGEWAQGNPDLLLRMHNEGHEIGTMGYTPAQDGNLSFVKDDLKKAIAAIEHVLGVPPHLYYCGLRNTTISARAARSLELQPVMCTVDLVCSSGAADDIVRRAYGNTNGGDILLVSPTAAFSQALGDLLVYYRELGLTASTTSSTIYN